MYSQLRIDDISHVMQTLPLPTAVDLYERAAQAYHRICSDLGIACSPDDYYFSHFDGHARSVNDAAARFASLGFYGDFVAYVDNQLAVAQSSGSGGAALAALEEVAHLLEAVMAIHEDDLRAFVQGTQEDGPQDFESLKTFLLTLFELAQSIDEETMSELVAWFGDGVPVLQRWSDRGGAGSL